MNAPLPLCHTFQSRAYWTWHTLAVAYQVGGRLQEETITDLNILEFMRQHPTQVKSCTFNKHEEGINGADWEWWFTSANRTNWIGFRLQAKVIDLKAQHFRHLHYRSKKDRHYQCDKLIADSLNQTPPRIPLYCFYTFAPNTTRHHSRHALTMPAYGASLLSAFTVHYLRVDGHKHDLASLLPHFQPWSILACTDSTSIPDLAYRAHAAWKSDLLATDARLFRQLTRTPPSDVDLDTLLDYRNQLLDITPTQRPPDYVLQIVEGGDVERPDDPELATVTVLSEEP